MPDIKIFEIASWPLHWRESGEVAKAKILATPALGINSPEYHEYMDYCAKLVIYSQELKSRRGGT
uniref:Uncharacterized protein n=1 Tax=viral metagenome TaxID=1070528 RepID=A0A6M3Y2D7_9ZZZZ